jgi:tetratricopeptide (TPR) repeat protein
MGTGTTKVSERMTWKQLEKCTREKNDDFAQLLAQNFLLLDQLAKEKKDPISQSTLDVINAGFMDLTRAVDKRKAAGEATPDFTHGAYTLFSRLAESYNNPNLLKQAGLHFMTEWRLPEAALRYFERALQLGGTESAMRSLIEVASIGIRRKEEMKKGITVQKNAATSGYANMANIKISQRLRSTDKVLLTKHQRPAAPAMTMVLNRNAKATALLPDPAKEALEGASQQIAAGNLPVAHKWLLKAAKYPVKKEVLCGLWSNLGRACYQAGDHAGMEEAYGQAYVYDPRGSNTYFNLALAKSLNKKIDEAEQLYQMAGKIDPNNPKVWCNLGVLYFQHDRFQEAEHAFQTAIHHRPDYARAWDNLGSTLSAMGKIDEAIEACKKAIQYKPGYPEAYFKLSALYLDKSDPASLTQAVDALSHVVGYAPLAASATAMLSMVQSRLAEVDSAKASLQRAVQSDPNCELLPTVWNELETAIRAS